jgi:hypothetical protein
MKVARPIALFALALPAGAQCSEWSDGFQASGLDAVANSLEVYDDGSGPALYVGGTFDFAGEARVNGIARWDGTQWSALGSGVGGSVYVYKNQVLDLIAHDDGSGSSLFASGVFDNGIGGVSLSGIARWDGTQWHPVGANLYGDGGPMIAFDDGSGNGTELYLAGNFSTTLAPSKSLVRWDGLQWRDVGGWNAPGIRALEVYDDGTGSALYAAGTFTTAYGAPSDRISKWDGTAWIAVGSGLDDTVWDLAAYDDGSGARLFVGGLFDVIGVPGLSEFVAWDGASWSDPGCAQVDTVTRLDPVLEPGQTQPSLFVYVEGGTSRVQRLSAGACQPIGVGPNERVHEFATFDDGTGAKVFAVGWFRLAGSERADYIASWDGTSWAPLTVGRSAFWPVHTLGVADVGAGPALYGDAAGNAAGTGRAVGRMDATGWTPIGEANYGDILSVGPYDDGTGERLVVGGEFPQMGGKTVNKIATWDGTAWGTLKAGVGGGEVETVATFDFGSGEELLIGGQFQKPGKRVARWNGSAWSKLAQGFDKRVKAFATYDEGAGPRLFAGGHITRKLPFNGTNIIMHRLSRWSGAQWESVGTNDISDPVHALAVYDDGLGAGPRLIVGGEFGFPGDAILAWDGTAYQSLSSGLQWGNNEGIVYALAVYDDGAGPALFVGGWFDSAGGVPVRNLARWDGVQWSDVGGGVDDCVESLVVFDDGAGHGPALFVGGDFKEAGGVASLYVARWGRPLPCAAAYCASGVSSAGCTAALAGLGTASATAASPFDLSVAGADVNSAALIFYGVGGPKATPWGVGGSLHCVRAPLQRTGPQVTAGAAPCTGSVALDWNAFLTSRPNALGNPFAAGQTVWAQGWIADPLATYGGELSNAITFPIQP